MSKKLIEFLCIIMAIAVIALVALIFGVTHEILP